MLFVDYLDDNGYCVDLMKKLLEEVPPFQGGAAFGRGGCYKKHFPCRVLGPVRPYQY
jgi:hypothetical protein